MSDQRHSPLTMRRVVTLVILVVAVFVMRYFGLLERPSPAPNTDTPPVGDAGSATASPSAGADIIRAAFRDEASDIIVEARGTVDRVLGDDNDGSRHQRFIVRLAPDLTILIAHNIDLAPRVPLHEGDTVTFKGEYEWSDRGGIVHWTHHDPKGWRPGGWIEHSGQRYE